MNLLSRVSRRVPRLPLSRIVRAQSAARPMSTEQDKKPPADMDFSKLRVNLTATPKPKSPYHSLRFGKEFSDHLLEIDWDAINGWHAPLIKPYGPFTLDPACSVFHYALEAFEGMKAYLDKEGNVRLFRPQMNTARLQSSCEALSFPTFDGRAFEQCLEVLLNVDRDWIPQAPEDGYSLYIRPTVISTHPFIGVAMAESIKLYVILSPVGPYYEKGFKAINLLADDRYIRAWPKGTGDKKIGGNYGPTIRCSREAINEGFDQILWLFEDYVTEVGTSNQFFFWVNEKGEKELVTAPLDGTILPGVTRDSVLALAREWGEFQVSERPFTMKDVAKAADEGRMIESFGSGTAAIITPVKNIHYKGKDINIPRDPKDKSQEAGPLARRLFAEIMDIQYGRKKDHPWSVLVPKHPLDRFQ